MVVCCDACREYRAHCADRSDCMLAHHPQQKYFTCTACGWTCGGNGFVICCDVSHLQINDAVHILNTRALKGVITRSDHVGLFVVCCLLFVVCCLLLCLLGNSVMAIF